MNIEKLPGEIKELIHLRYLDLSSNESLNDLPDLVCSLFNLQTLKLKHCESLFKLPRGMQKMVNLKHLWLWNTADNLALPKEIEKLTSLRTLDKVNINSANGGSKLRVLKDLNRLQGKLKIKGLGNLKTANEASRAKLNKKEGLRFLELDFNYSDDEDDNDDDDDDEGFEENIDAPALENMERYLRAFLPHPNLKELSIKRYGGATIPFSWMASMTSLELTLYRCIEMPAALGQLPFLKTLTLRRLENLQSIGVENFCYGDGGNFSLPAFPKLEYLKVNEMEWLEEFDLGEEGSAAGSNRGGDIIIMPRLIEMEISECPALKTLKGLSRLQSLKTLNLWTLHNFEEIMKSGGEGGGDDSLIINMLSLEDLQFGDCQKLKSSSLHQLHLPKLNRLFIHNCASLSDQLPTITSLEISYASHSFPPQGLTGCQKLQRLSFDQCSFMTCIPEDIRHLTTLQTLDIIDCECLPENTNPDCIMEQEDEEAWSIMAHIPNITIKRWGKYELISTLTPTRTRQQSYRID